MNTYLKLVSRWLRINKLSLNILKTVYIVFGLYADSVPEALDIHIENKRLNRVYTCKYLGIYIDSRLKWEYQIEHLVKKTKYLVYVIAILFKILNLAALMTIYYALFHSIGTYGIIAWGGAYSTTFSQIQNVQTRLIKKIKKKPGNVISPLSMKECYLLEAMVENFNILSMSFKNSTSKTRNKVILPDVSKTIALRNHDFVARKIFCKFDRNMKTIVTSAKNLKKKIKEWIMANTETLINIELLLKNELI